MLKRLQLLDLINESFVRESCEQFLRTLSPSHYTSVFSSGFTMRVHFSRNVREDDIIAWECRFLVHLTKFIVCFWILLDVFIIQKLKWEVNRFPRNWLKINEIDGKQRSWFCLSLSAYEIDWKGCLCLCRHSTRARNWLKNIWNRLQKGIFLCFRRLRRIRMPEIWPCLKKWT